MTQMPPSPPPSDDTPSDRARDTTSADVDEMVEESFPASDPPSSWSGAAGSADD